MPDLPSPKSIESTLNPQLLGNHLAPKLPLQMVFYQNDKLPAVTYDLKSDGDHLYYRSDSGDLPGHSRIGPSRFMILIIIILSNVRNSYKEVVLWVRPAAGTELKIPAILLGGPGTMNVPSSSPGRQNDRACQ
jgi:hypothetical protein